MRCCLAASRDWGWGRRDTLEAYCEVSPPLFTSEAPSSAGPSKIRTGVLVGKEGGWVREQIRRHEFAALQPPSNWECVCVRVCVCLTPETASRVAPLCHPSLERERGGKSCHLSALHATPV